MFCNGTSATPLPISSVTIAGVAAVELISQIFSNSDTNGIVAIWAALVPTGATATVSVVNVGSVRRMGVGLYSLYRNKASIAAGDSYYAAGTTNPSVAVALPKRGVGLILNAVGDASSGTFTSSYTGATKTFDRVVEASSNLSSALLTDQAVAIANNGDSGNIGIWASWGPY